MLLKPLGHLSRLLAKNAGALVASRIDRLVYGAADPKAGFCGSLGNLVQDPRLNHRLEVSAGTLAEESAALLRGFFASLRAPRSPGEPSR